MLCEVYGEDHQATEEFISHLEMDLGDSESGVLERRLQSKSEALLIMRKELEKYRVERDQFKLMAETVQMRYMAIKKSLSDVNSLEYFQGSIAASIINETREQNWALTTQVEALKQRLTELKGDMKLLRLENTNLKLNMDHTNAEKEEAMQIEWIKEKSKYLNYLEHYRQKNLLLQNDLRSLIDEKEEIIIERDSLKSKVRRLNYELFIALQGNKSTPKILDIDSLILENNYLQEKIKSIEEQLEATTDCCNKYKTMLDSKRKKGIRINDSEMLFTKKQAKSLMEKDDKCPPDMPVKNETISELKTLCLTLLDNVNDKNVALNHQKKANKLLATKIGELEHRLEKFYGEYKNENNCTLLSQSVILLNGYNPVEEHTDHPNSTEIKETVLEVQKKSETIPISRTDRFTGDAGEEQESINSMCNLNVKNIFLSELSNLSMESVELIANSFDRLNDESVSS